ncbi:MAG: hypothetical protein A3E82_09700 [Gammaproteobacteria bacterium RIFCSPHIGHO2_12_FULL_38_11]|nr:MAG: hypothetical protein A3E82_09700 [Gammaproteobacteria bacterium RIFCSPHIGHO2_12_FULL_38_11]
MPFELSVKPAKYESDVKLTLSHYDAVGVVVDGEEISPEPKEIITIGFIMLFRKLYQSCINTDDIINLCYSKIIPLMLAMLQVISKIYNELLNRDNDFFPDEKLLEKNIRDFCEFLDNHNDFKSTLNEWLKQLKKNSDNTENLTEKLTMELNIEKTISTQLLQFFEKQKIFLNPDQRTHDGISVALKNNEDVKNSVRTLELVDAVNELNLSNRMEELKILKNEIEAKQNTYKNRKAYTGFPFFRSKSNSAEYKEKATHKMIDQIDSYEKALKGEGELILHADYWNSIKTQNKAIYDAANQGTLKNLLEKVKNNIEGNAQQDKDLFDRASEVSQRTFQ